MASRGTVSQTAYSSIARTATPTAVSYSSEGRRGMHVIIDVTAVTATPSVVATIDSYDSASDKWYNLLTSAAFTATGTRVLRVYPGATVAANLSTNDIVPGTFRIVMTHGNADSITYSVSVHLVP